LHHTPGVGTATFARLLLQFGEPESVFVTPNQAENISGRTKAALAKPDWDRVEKELAWFDQPNRHIITLYDSRYPALLKQIADPPSLLFVQGDVSLLSSWQVAVVGSRNPSASGRDTAYEFARYIAQGDVAITSGLAMGIDAAAHKGALTSGKTVAVIGTGLDSVYPAKNRTLATDIEIEGALVSEFALGTQPRAENFPRRNRIISGLSLGTLVVEAAIRSGSLITARMALEQGREVFAIPGSIHNPLARGCHRLIREGAKLVETAQDILEDLGPLAGAQRLAEVEQAEPKTASTNDDAEYRTLFEHLGYDPIEIDVIIQKSGLTAEAVSSMLLLLELQGQVESLPGGRYVRISS